MPELREVMNVRQASQYLGISPDTLYKYVAEEKIPAFKLGNRWKFKKTMLDRWMERQSRGTARQHLATAHDGGKRKAAGETRRRRVQAAPLAAAAE